MATVIRPEVSTKNKYYVEKHRHYELKHFCLQYPTWKRIYSELDGLYGRDIDSVRSTDISNPTLNSAEKRLLYLDKMELIEQTALAADADLAQYIIVGVTEGLSFNQLKIQHDIPCGKDMYYDRYRRFFWLLDRARN